MLKKIKIYHFIMFLFLFLFIMRYDLIFLGIKFLFFTVYESIFNFNRILVQLDILSLDILISILSLFVTIPLLFYINNKYNIFKQKIRIPYLIFIPIIFSILFAPLITQFHPNAQPDVRAARFLKPLSSILTLHLSRKKMNSRFAEVKKEIVKSPNITDKVYANSISEEDTHFILVQGNSVTKIEKERVLFKEGKPVITETYFIFGTDELGRDVFARIIYGARISIFIALITVALSLTIGVFLGFWAAYLGGYFNLVLSRFTDVFLTIPSIFFVIMILAFWGNSIFAVIVVLALTGWMSLFKIVKGEVASIIQKDYFVSSKKIGLPLNKLLLKEILPAIKTQLVIATIFQFSNVILAESALSYLGIGVGINLPSWGNMILSGQKYMSSGEWLIIIPGVLLILSILVINDFGEKLKRESNTWMKDD